MSCQGWPECSVACYCDVPREWDGPVCFHCYSEIETAEVIDSIGETFCSTFCSVAVTTYGHTENCTAPSCADGVPITLPPMLCGLCDQPTDGDTAHPACREALRAHLGFNAAVRAGASS